VFAISLLFVKHACVFFLGGDILKTVALFDGHLFGLFLLVFFEHFLQVHLLLLSFVGEHLALSIHLFLESLNEFELLVVVNLLLNAASLLLELELTVTRFFLSNNFGCILFGFFIFLLTEELNMLGLHNVVLCSLFFFRLLGFVLVVHLIVKLLLDESGALFLTEDSLLLLLVMQQGVELLNSKPFIFLINFRVNISLPGLGT